MLKKLTLHIQGASLGLCNAPATFQRAIIGVFSEMVNDYMEVFMDDFTTYGDSFDEALEKLEKVLKHCEHIHLSMNTKKCHMMMSEGVVMGHFISGGGNHVDPSKIKVIKIFLSLGRRKR